MAIKLIDDQHLVNIANAIRSHTSDTITETKEWDIYAKQSYNGNTTFDFTTARIPTKGETYDVITINGASKVRVKFVVRGSYRYDVFNVYIMEGNTQELSGERYTGLGADCGKVMELYFDSDTVTIYNYCDISSDGNWYYAEVTGYDATGAPINDGGALVGTEEITRELVNTYTVDKMADAISAIETGSGGFEPPESEFDLVGELDYRFAGKGNDWLLQMFGDRYTTRSIARTPYMFHKSDVTHIPFEFNFATDGAYCAYMFDNAGELKSIPSIDFAQTKPRDATKMFHYCTKVEEIGTIKNLYANNISEMFHYCYKLSELPKFENLQLTTDAVKSDIFSSCHSLREIPIDFLQELVDKGTSTVPSYYSPIYDGGFRHLYALDEITVPVYGTFTSQEFTSTFSYGYRMKNILFKTQEDGTPYTAQWRNQTIDLTKFVGYAQYSNEVTNTNSSITVDKEVTDDATYQALKDDPDWFTAKIEYSRYNHDSAVATIMSLPDTSAYLATAGGTNTIKFTGSLGSKTDGGPISALTEEEIKIANDKGWQVQIV